MLLLTDTVPVLAELMEDVEIEVRTTLLMLLLPLLLLLLLLLHLLVLTKEAGGGRRQGYRARPRGEVRRVAAALPQIKRALWNRYLPLERTSVRAEHDRIRRPEQRTCCNTVHCLGGGLVARHQPRAPPSSERRTCCSPAWSGHGQCCSMRPPDSE